MTKTELLEFIAQGENSEVEFKRDDIQRESLAKEMSALLNTEGGIILLGVEDNGEISGMSRDCQSAEEWLMHISQDCISPIVAPKFSFITMDDDKQVGVIELRAKRFKKPYRARIQKFWVAYVRVGSTSRKAFPSEEVRLYDYSEMVKYEKGPVPDMDMESLDWKRVLNYFKVILKRQPPELGETLKWRNILVNSDLLVEMGNDGFLTSVAGLLLFGKNPNRRLHQAGVLAVAFHDTEKDYNTIDEERIRGPLVSLFSDDHVTVEGGVIDRSVDFVKRNMGGVARLKGARRHIEKSYPLDAVRESIVNAVVHRDYTKDSTDIEISLYSDRLEIISPGGLHNGVTVEKMKQGIVRETRNGLLRDILRDYLYVDHFGMGVRNRIIKSMREHNGTEPELIDANDRFTVRLWKSPPQAQNPECSNS